MTAVFPDGVSVLGREALFWVPSLANPATPKVSEITAGVAIQSHIRGFTPQGNQGSSADIRLSTVDQFENPGRNQVSIDAIEVVYDPQLPTDATKYKAYTALVPLSTGYIVDRRGLTEATAAAIGQIVDVYTCTLGVRNRVGIDPSAEGGKFASTIKPFVTGKIYQDVAVVTG